MRIMVCFDGSEEARAALIPARMLASSAGAEIHVVRVAQHDVTASGVAWSGSDAVDIAKHRQALDDDQQLREEMVRLAADFPRPPLIEVLEGQRVADELLRYARAHAIDLFVLGCRQRGPFHGGVGGEVTARLAESGIAPVLLGPMVMTSHLNLAAVPPGCAVFSRDGFFLGYYLRLADGRIEYRRDDGTTVAVPDQDALELSVASGLRLRFDRVDLPAHAAVAAPSSTRG